MAGHQTPPHESRRADLWVLAAITVLGAVLRLWTLGEKSVNGDEMNMARFVTGERDLSLNFGNAHAYILILRLFSYFGLSDFIFRLPAALAGIAAIPLIYRVGRTVAGRPTGLVTALFLALSPIHIDLSQMIHSYALFCYLSLLSFYFMWQAYHKSSTGHWIAFAVANGINFNVHLYTVFVIGCEIAVLLVWTLQRSWPLKRWNLGAWPHWRRVIVVAVIILALSGSVLMDTIYPMLSEMGKKISGSETEVAQLSRQTPRMKWSVKTFEKAFRELAIWQSKRGSAAVAAYAVLVLGLIFLLREKRAAGLAVLTWIFVPLFPVAVFTHVTTIDFGTRRLIFVLPLAVLAASAGVTGVVSRLRRAIRPRWSGRKNTIFAAAVVAVLAVSFAMTIVKDYFLHYERPDFRFAAQLLSRHAAPEDLILSWKPFQLDYYLPETVEVHSIAHRKLPRLQALYAESSGIWYLRPGAVRGRPQFRQVEAWLKTIGAYDTPMGGGLFLAFTRRGLSPQETGAARVDVLSDAIVLKPGRWYLHMSLGHAYRALRQGEAATREIARAKALRAR